MLLESLRMTHRTNILLSANRHDGISTARLSHDACLCARALDGSCLALPACRLNFQIQALNTPLTAPPPRDLSFDADCSTRLALRLQSTTLTFIAMHSACYFLSAVMSQASAQECSINVLCKRPVMMTSHQTPEKPPNGSRRASFMTGVDNSNNITSIPQSRMSAWTQHGRRILSARAPFALAASTYTSIDGLPSGVLTR